MKAQTPWYDIPLQRENYQLPKDVQIHFAEFDIKLKFESEMYSESKHMQ
jgi:hypothetical protein